MNNYQYNLPRQPSRLMFLWDGLQILAAQSKFIVTNIVSSFSVWLSLLVYWSIVGLSALLAVGGVFGGAFVFSSLISKFDFTITTAFRIYALGCLIVFGLLYRLMKARHSVPVPFLKFASDSRHAVKNVFTTLYRLFTDAPIRQDIAVTASASYVTGSAASFESANATPKAKRSGDVVLTSFCIISDYAPGERPEPARKKEEIS